MALRIEPLGLRGDVVATDGDTAAGWPIRFAERLAGCGAPTVALLSCVGCTLRSRGVLFWRAINDQLRTGTDKGNPTV